METHIPQSSQLDSKQSRVLAAAIALKCDVESLTHIVNEARPEFRECNARILETTQELIHMLEELFNVRGSEAAYYREMARRTGALCARLQSEGVDPRGVKMGQIAASPHLNAVAQECGLSLSRGH